MTRRFLAIILFGVYAALPLAADASDFTDHFIPAKPGAAAPAFPFKDGKGMELTLKDFRGRYVLLSLWATWCGPCVHEMPSLDRLAAKFSDKATPPPSWSIKINMTADTLNITQPHLAIIPLTEDREGLVAATNFYKTQKLSHLGIFIDDTGMGPSIFHIPGLPTTFLIDPNGMIIGHIEGETDWDNPDTIAYLKKLMHISGP